jgi:hypothetical protein
MRKNVIDPMLESFRFIERDAEEKYYPGYTYYPGTVYDVFGMPMYDDSEYAWYPYSYGWDGSSGYQLPYQNTGQFPQYTGYDHMDTPILSTAVSSANSNADSGNDARLYHGTDDDANGSAIPDSLTVPVSSGGEIEELMMTGWII